jgi:hypothetical protein
MIQMTCQPQSHYDGVIVIDTGDTGDGYSCDYLAGAYRKHFGVIHTMSGLLIMCPGLVKKYVHTAPENAPEMDTVVIIWQDSTKNISE